MINGFISQDKYDDILRLIPIVCVDVAIAYRGKILIVERRDAPCAGQWWLPGGRLFKGEGLEDCARRKAKEEVGLKGYDHCFGLEMVYYTSTIFDTVHSVNFVYLAFADSDKVELDETCLDHKWVDTINRDYHQYIRAALFKSFMRMK